MFLMKRLIVLTRTFENSSVAIRMPVKLQILNEVYIQFILLVYSK